MKRLTFKEVETAFIQKNPNGKINKVNNGKYEVCYNFTAMEEPSYNGMSIHAAMILQSEWEKEYKRINKVYAYSVANLYELAKRLKLDELTKDIDKVKEEERKTEEEKSIENWNNTLGTLFGMM